MKGMILLRSVIVLLATCGGATGQLDYNYIPRIETVTTSQGAVVRRLVVDTSPGIVYSVMFSTDLENWSGEASQVYGLGHSLVVPMVEAVPAPPGSCTGGPRRVRKPADEAFDRDFRFLAPAVAVA